MICSPGLPLLRLILVNFRRRRVLLLVACDKAHNANHSLFALSTQQGCCLECVLIQVDSRFAPLQTEDLSLITDLLSQASEESREEGFIKSETYPLIEGYIF